MDKIGMCDACREWIRGGVFECQDNLEGAINEFLDFEATLFVDIEL